MIGAAPSGAELLSVNVTDFACPTFTLPKSPDGGLIFKFSGTGVAVYFPSSLDTLVEKHKPDFVGHKE